MELAVYGLVFAAVAAFVYAGVALFRQGWTSYEERYVEGASASLDAVWLSIPPQVLLYLSFACAFAAGFAGAMVFQSLYAGIPFAAAGLLVPRLLLSWRKRQRDRLFNEQLVHALGNMVSSLKGGMSLPQSMEMIAREMDSPIRQEFGLVVQQTRLGVTLEDALADLLERMPSPDLDLVVTSILISKEVGGNLSEIFTKIAATIRERQRIEGRIRTLSAMGRLQGWIMGSLPVGIGLYLYYFQPDYIAPLFTNPIGWFLMAGAAVWMSAGVLVIRKILAIDI